MILYHGSKTIVESLEIRIERYNKDFYFGFYYTNMLKQAERWATRDMENGIVNCYEYFHNNSLNIKKFQK